MSNFFVTGGTMKPDAPSYILRAADEELFRALLANEFCSVLTTRQMGKSSLMARTAARLREQGVQCAVLDLQGKGDLKSPPEQWYYGVVKQIATGLNLAGDWAEWWKQQGLLLPAQRMTDFFADIVLKQIAGPIVVFIDEVDWMIRMRFSDEFFAAIRSCYNRRATEPEFNRLSFVLLGSAAPAQLIKNPTRTPFNIGRAIELGDFTAEEAKTLVPALGEQGEAILSRILYWTDGHPYLTQMLCAKVIEQKPDGEAAETIVDRVVSETLLSTGARLQENNLKFVGDRLTQGTRDLRKVLLVYRDVLRGLPVQDMPASPVHTSLRLSGVLKPDVERRLQVRNRVYNQVFDERWVREKMPLDVRLLISAAAAVILVAIVSFWYLVLFPRAYVQALETASSDAEAAYSSYKALQKPLHCAKAEELFAQFWERREDRDAAILARARTGDSSKLSDLIGADYGVLQRTFRHGEDVNAVVFSPDGKLVATGSADKTARVFEVATGREVARLIHEGDVNAVAFSPDGKLVATGSADRTVRVFGAATGQEMAHMVDQSAVRSVAFSPDGKLIVTGSEDTVARVWSAASGQLLVSLRGHTGMVWSAAFSHNGQYILTASQDMTARVWNSRNGHLKVILRGHSSYVYTAVFSPDGQRILTASNDKTARVWSAASGHLLATLQGHDDSVWRAEFSSDGQRVLTASWDRTARVWSAASGHLLVTLRGHTSYVYGAVFSPDGQLILTASADWTARLFEAETGREVVRLAHRGSLHAVAFSPDGTLVATGSSDGTVRVFGAVTRRGVVRLVHESSVNAVAFSLDAKLIATGSSDGTVRVFEAVAGREVARLFHGSPVNALSFSPDGKLVAAASSSGAWVFEAATGREVARLTHQDIVRALSFSPDGKLVAAASSSGAWVFEATTGQKVARLTQQDIVRALSFSPDGKLVAAGSDDKTALVFELATGREMAHLVHQDSVDAVVFSPEGKLLVTQTANWLHLYEGNGDLWRPVANRYVPVLWKSTVRFMAAEAHCPRCVEMLRDLPENQFAPSRIDFDKHDPQPIQGTPQELVKEWSAKLGLMFDKDGRIVPLQTNPH